MEQVPKENETIAAKKSVRVAEKLRRDQKRIRITPVWWNSVWFEVFLISLIFLLNFYSVYGYLGTSQIFETFYSGPIIPLISKFIESFGLPLTFSLQLVNILFFLTFPFCLYVFIKEVTERKIVAFLSILFVSLPFYPFAQTRVFSSLAGVDGAHISSLSITLLALLSLYKFLKEGGSRNLIQTSILSSTVLLTSPFGFSTYIIFSAILTFSEMLLGRGRLKILRFFSIIFFTALMVSFWYNPHFSYWMLTGSLGEEVRRTFFKLLPISLFAMPALGVFGYLLFDRKPNLQPVFLASFFTIAFATISLAGGGVFPSHPSRYVSELGISLSFLISVSIIKLGESFFVFRNNKFYFRLMLTIVFFALSSSIMFGRKNLQKDDQVLGMWTGIEKGTVWKEREKFNGISAVSGYVITSTGILFLGLVSYGSKKKSI